MPKPPPTRSLQVRLPAQTWWEIKLKAAELNVPERVVLTLAVAAFVGENIKFKAGNEVLYAQNSK